MSGLPLFLISVLGLEQCEGRRQQDLQVEQHRPVLDVVEIMLDAALELLRRDPHDAALLPESLAFFKRYCLSCQSPSPR